MSSRIILLFCAMCMLVAGQSPSAQAAGEDEFVGSWKGTAGAGGFTETWTIEKGGDGKLTVTGAFDQDGQVKGKFKGNGVKYEDGKLSFTQELTQKPDDTWKSGAKMTATVEKKEGEEDKLMFHWQHEGGAKGDVTLTRKK